MTTVGKADTYNKEAAMPLVRVHYNPQRFLEVDNLRVALEELVPATFNCREGRLTPGSITYIAKPKGDHDGMRCDVFVEIEAYRYEALVVLLDELTEGLHKSLKVLFPNTTFSLWPKLVEAGWASDVDDPESDADMSPRAALERAVWMLKELRTTS